MKINLPNGLTLLRIFLVPFLVVVLLTKFDGRETVGLLIFLTAVATDFLDGWFARRRSEITTLGALLDPIADKLLISAAFISLVELGLAPAWMVVVVIGREFAVSGLRSIASERGIVISASAWGKAKMATQIAAVSLLDPGAAPRRLRPAGADRPLARRRGRARLGNRILHAVSAARHADASVPGGRSLISSSRDSRPKRSALRNSPGGAEGTSRSPAPPART